MYLCLSHIYPCLSHIYLCLSHIYLCLSHIYTIEFGRLIMDMFAKESVYIYVRISVFIYGHTFDSYFSHIRSFVPDLCVSPTCIQVNSGDSLWMCLGRGLYIYMSVYLCLYMDTRLIHISHIFDLLSQICMSLPHIYRWIRAINHGRVCEGVCIYTCPYIYICICTHVWCIFLTRSTFCPGSLCLSHIYTGEFGRVNYGRVCQGVCRLAGRRQQKRIYCHNCRWPSDSVRNCFESSIFFFPALVFPIRIPCVILFCLVVFIFNSVLSCWVCFPLFSPMTKNVLPQLRTAFRFRADFVF